MYEKPIRGILYVDQEEINDASEEMLLHLNSVDTFLKTAEKKGVFEEAAKVGSSRKDVELELCNINAITALTRYDEEDDMNYNLIIPKESLSIGLVNELEKLDVGKDMLYKYMQSRYNNTPENHRQTCPRLKESIEDEQDKMVQQEINKLTETFDKMGIPVAIRKLSDDEAKQLFSEMGMIPNGIRF